MRAHEGVNHSGFDTGTGNQSNTIKCLSYHWGYSSFLWFVRFGLSKRIVRSFRSIHFFHLCKFRTTLTKEIYPSHRIHGTGIFTYIWFIFMVNVGKFTIHGSFGHEPRCQKRPAVTAEKAILAAWQWSGHTGMFRILEVENWKGCKNICPFTRWFKVTSLYPCWRSLSLWKGHLTNHPKKVTKHC